MVWEERLFSLTILPKVARVEVVIRRDGEVDHSIGRVNWQIVDLILSKGIRINHKN